MQKSPKNKVIGTTPNTKKEDEKKDKATPAEVTTSVSAIEAKENEVTPAESKQIQVITKSILDKTNADPYATLTRPQIELIKRLVAKEASDDELKMFLSVCQGTQLNPFLKQVHFVSRWDSREARKVGTIQVGIDGFRAIAESGGQYAGSDDAVFKDEAEQPFKVGAKGHEVEKKIKVPGSATVTVYKLLGEKRYPFTATARWAEYFPGGNQGYMWLKMPYGQLAKCAESLALRKAFPKLLSGLYAPEEMAQAGGAEEKPKDVIAFEKTKKIIAANSDVAGLQDAGKKIEASALYSDEQKETLRGLITERIETIKKEQAKALAEKEQKEKELAEANEGLEDVTQL